MSYQGYTPVMVDYLEAVHKARKSQQTIETIRILEIGVDRGQTAIPLMANLSFRGVPFVWQGVDIRWDDCLSQQITLMEGFDHWFFAKSSKSKSIACYTIMNSLDYLEQNKNVFDLVLIDGDHNYDTVSKELSFLDAITHSHSLVICDDYSGRHSGKDSFYSDYDSHKGLKELSVDLDKSQNKGGVTAAVDDFIKNSNDWRGYACKEFEVYFMAKRLSFSYKLLDKVKDSAGRSMFHPENFECTFDL